MNMMNNKGFTLIELITTFALSTVIIILLVNVVLVIKNLYIKFDVKSKLLIEQSNLSNLMNKKIYNGNVNSHTSCGTACFTFDYIDGTSSILVVSEDKIAFDNYVYKAEDGVIIGELNVYNPENFDDLLVIEIPISHNLYPNEDFGISIVYRYNS